MSKDKTDQEPAQHTPGPWTYEAEPNGLTFSVWHDDDTAIAETNSKADACLIAAAPELLAALKECLCRLDEHDSQSAPEAIQARAAIAKATGQEDNKP